MRIKKNFILTGFLMLLNTLMLSTVDLRASHTVVSKVFPDEPLYPQTLPYKEGYLQVSEQHQIYYAEFGNPEGVPVVTVHGGPGSQSYASWTAFFDPEFFHVIMFDQRGSGRSKPFGEMSENTPQHSVEDMEKLREHLSIEQWVLFGGSYGSFLSLLYGETHPSRCLGFALRGIFLGKKRDYNHIMYEMKTVYPEAWQEMAQHFPEHERTDLTAALYRDVMDPNPSIHLRAAKAFMKYDTICANLIPTEASVNKVETDETFTLGIGRAFLHYTANAFFIEDNQILVNLSKITHLPAYLVNGRYDIICPPRTAYELFENWPTSELCFVSDAGHSSNERGTMQALKESMDKMKERLKQ